MSGLAIPRLLPASLRGRAPVQPPVGDGGPGARPPLSHGFKVGVGSVAIAASTSGLERDLGALDVDGLRRAWPGPEAAEAAVRAAHTTPGLDEAAVAETMAKHADPETLGRRLELLADRWPGLRDRLQEQLIPAARLRELLAAAGCPTRPSELGLTASAFRATYERARMIRRRYTVLDLAAETGLLGELVDELFAPPAPGPTRGRPGPLGAAGPRPTGCTAPTCSTWTAPSTSATSPPGAERLVRALRERDLPVRFLSNNPTKDPEQYAARLDGLGLPTPVTEIVNTVVTMTRWLLDNAPDAVVYPISEPPLLRALEAAGIRTSSDPPRSTSWSPATTGASPTRSSRSPSTPSGTTGGPGWSPPTRTQFCPFPGGRGEPDCAAITAAVEACTGVRGDRGKPDPAMLHAALAGLRVAPGECVMVGDRLTTDIRMALDAGWRPPWSSPARPPPMTPGA